MKRIILIFCLIASVGVIHGQIVNLDGASNVLYGTATNTSEELDLLFDVICNASEATDIKCSATVIQIVAGSKYQYCWGASCSPWVAVNNTLPDVITMAPQESNSSYHVKFRHYGYMGQSIVRFCWYDVNNTADMFCYDINFCVDAVGGCVVSVNEITLEAEIAQITPNPANEMTSIGFEFNAKPTHAQLSIYNMVGELVESHTINQRVGQVRINTSMLEGGIYFCTLTNEGKKYGTKRLVVNH